MLLCCQLSALVKSLPRSGEIITHLIFESKALESLDLIKRRDAHRNIFIYKKRCNLFDCTVSWKTTSCGFI